MLSRTLVVLGALTGCVDEPINIVPRGGGSASDRLSQLGLFDDLANQHPAVGVIPYDVVAPLWSDGASKLRFIVPDGGALHGTEDQWAIVPGTYLVKTFYFPHDERDPLAGRQLIETRVIRFTSTGSDEATYLWNSAQTEAFASGGNEDVTVRWIDANGATRVQTHHVPGTSQCSDCHRDDAATRGLGIRTPELARSGTYPDGTTDQISYLAGAGVVDIAPTAANPFVDPYVDGQLDPRALSYLEINCGTCHSPGGIAAGTGVDWRRDHALDNLCRPTTSVDGRDRVIVPGAPDASEMIARMRSTDPFVHMPREPSHIPDDRGIQMLSDWIASLAPAGCP